MRRSTTSSPHSTQERPPALLGRLLSAVPSSRRSVIVAVVLGLVSTLSLVIQVVGLSLWLSNVRHSNGATWFFVGLGLRILVVTLSWTATTAAAAPVRRELRKDALVGILESPSETRHGDELSDLLARGGNEVADFLALYTPALILSVLAPLVLLAWMAWTDLWSAFIIAATILALPIFMILMGIEAQEKMNERFVERQRAVAYFGDVLRGLTTLKLHRRESVVLEGFEAVENQLLNSTMATLRVAFLSSFSLELLASLATALVALTLGIRLMHGSIALHVALAVLLVTPETYLPLRRAASRFHDAHDGVSAATELLSLVAPPRILAPISFHEQIVVKGLMCSHSGREHNGVAISFVVTPREWVEIVGPSGAGKTTLLRTLAGLRPAQGGSVWIDGTPLDDTTRTTWSQQIAWLGQDQYLDGDSVRDAVRALRRSLSDDQIVAMLRRLQLDLSLDEPIGENGARLSAGQRRRVLLARTLITGPSMVFLDEPFAHLDRESVSAIEQVLNEFSATFIVVTHRASRHATQTIDLGIQAESV